MPSRQRHTPVQLIILQLQDCINYAYEHQDSVINADLDVKSAEYKVKETIGQGLPQVNGTASFQDYLKIPTYRCCQVRFFGQPAQVTSLIPVQIRC